MIDLQERLMYLIEQYIKDQHTEDEFKELFEFIHLPQNEHAVKSALGLAISQLELPSPGAGPILSDKRAEEIFKTITQSNREKPLHGIIRPMFRKWLSVAAIIAVILTATLVYVLSSRQPAAPVASINNQSIKDVKPPSSVNAVITLSNGQQLVLDSLNAGLINAQANAQIVKSADGQIIYKAEPSAQMAYNTLFVPRGSKVVNITLSDGTRVWLNSESTLKYPVAFSGKERKVEINGEAYFEVAHRNGQPFKVQKGDMCVTVLGTHFNVNSYDDEPDVKVTLLEGSVKINNGDEVGMLKPGQQARIASGLTINSNADVAEAIAWKEGKFQFGEATGITTIMRQLARWYNVEIIYEGAVNGNVGGSIARDIPVSQALKMLEMTGMFSFRIENNKVFVKELN